MKKNLFLLLIPFIALMSSCGNDDPTLDLETPNLEVGSDGGTTTVKFTTNSDWNIVFNSNVNWIEALQTSGKSGKIEVTLALEKNETTEKREVVCKVIAAGKLEKSLKIVQLASVVNDDISLSESEIKATSAEKIVSINVVTEVSWNTADVPDWVTLNPDLGSGNTTVIVTIAENPEKMARVADIKFITGTKEAILAIDQAADTKLTDKEILIKLYEALDGANWKTATNWCTDAPLSHWYGIKTNAEGNVTEISINSNKLTGTIPAEIGDLKSLVTIMLNYNKIGPLPKEIGDLENLKSLSIRNSEVTGSIPAEFGKLKNLEELTLSTNNMEGAIPDEIGGMISLKRLNIFSNKFSGALPKSIGDLLNMEWLLLDGNEFTGEIPKELFGLPNLDKIYVYNNKLTGSIPQEIGNATKLTRIDFSNNELTGTLPASIGNLTGMTSFIIANTNITGDIPAGLGNLKKALTIDLQKNKLTGVIPASLGGLTATTMLYLNDNELSGSIPAELGSMKAIKALHIHNNNLTGELPVELANCRSLGIFTNMAGLNCSQNRLTGSIPSEYEEHTYFSNWVLNPQQEGYGFQAEKIEAVPQTTEFPRTAGSVTINVTSKKTWTASNTPSWLTLSAQSGSGDAEITATYSANNYSTERVVTIKFATEKAECTVEFKQAPSQVGDLEEEEL